MVDSEREDLKCWHLGENGDVFEVIAPKIEVLNGVNPVRFGFHVDQLEGQGFAHQEIQDFEV